MKNIDLKPFSATLLHPRTVAEPPLQLPHLADTYDEPLRAGRLDSRCTCFPVQINTELRKQSIPPLR